MISEITLEKPGYSPLEEWYEEPQSNPVEIKLLASAILCWAKNKPIESMVSSPRISERLVFRQFQPKYEIKVFDKDYVGFSHRPVEHRITSFTANRQEESVDLEQKFQRLIKEWKKETSHLSSMTKLVMHPKYQNIIGLGPAVLPILFRELEKNPDYWFWALRAITEEDPTNPEDAGDLRKMTESWLKWARKKGYL